jgi:hypothetical protein
MKVLSQLIRLSLTRRFEWNFDDNTKKILEEIEAKSMERSNKLRISKHQEILSQETQSQRAQIQ